MMEVSFDLSTVFDSDLMRFDTMALKRLNSRHCWAVPKVIDQMGELSAETQGLKRVLTTYDKLIDASDQVLYLLWRKKPDKPQYAQVVGMLKTGRRNLYLSDGKRANDDDGVPQVKQSSPVCVLDFYVYSSLQRVGNGHRMFEFMLQSEQISAWQTAIDKPSDALLSFLDKHYGLADPIWQMTNFVVYPAFFDPKLAPVPQPATKPSTPKTLTEEPKKSAERHDQQPAANGTIAEHEEQVTDGEADRDSIDRSPVEPPPATERPTTAHAHTHSSSIANNPLAVDIEGVGRQYSPSPKTRAALLPSSPRKSADSSDTVRLRTAMTTCSGSSTTGTGSMSDLSRQRKVASMGHQNIW